MKSFRWINSFILGVSAILLAAILMTANTSASESAIEQASATAEAARETNPNPDMGAEGITKDSVIGSPSKPGESTIGSPKKKGGGMSY